MLGVVAGRAIATRRERLPWIGCRGLTKLHAERALARRVIFEPHGNVPCVHVVVAPRVAVVRRGGSACAQQRAPARPYIEMGFAEIRARIEQILCERVRVREPRERALATSADLARPTAAEAPAPVERAVARDVVEKDIPGEPIRRDICV